MQGNDLCTFSGYVFHTGLGSLQGTDDSVWLWSDYGISKGSLFQYLWLETKIITVMLVGQITAKANVHQCRDYWCSVLVEASKDRAESSIAASSYLWEEIDSTGGAPVNGL